MPDESCRKCGGVLLDFAICAKCRTPIQFICRICGTITLEQIHDILCFRIVNANGKITNYPEQGIPQIRSY
jgi:hypothetical protein